VRKLFIEDLELAGKRVLVRLDYNVPGDDEGTNRATPCGRSRRGWRS